jgi:deoxyribose-phosphate aldolase
MTQSFSGIANARGPLEGLIEHTLLAPTATKSAIERLCAEACAHRLFAVCVQPIWVSHAVQSLSNLQVRVVSVIGFPLGAATSAVKAFETSCAVRDGASEIDMVVQLGALKAGDHAAVRADIAAVVQAASGAPVKVILETAYLSDAEKISGCELAEEAGARFVKTSTGFARPEFAAPQHAPGLGASLADVQLLRRIVGERLGVKASGGIRSAAFARELIEAGANRIGTSDGPGLLEP